MAISALGTLVLARQLGTAEFGVYGKAVAFSQLIGAVGVFGTDQLVLSGRLGFKSALLRGALIVSTSAALTIGASLVVLPSPMRPLVVVVVGSTALLQLMTSALAYAQYRGRDLVRAHLDLTLRTSNQAGLNGGAWVGASAATASVGGAVAVVAAAAAALLLLLRSTIVRGAPRLRDARWRDGVRYGLIGLLFSGSLLFLNTGVALQGDAEANAHARVVFLVYAAELAGAGAVCSEYFRARLYAAQGREDRRRIARRLRSAALVLAPVLAGGVATSAALVSWFLGTDYRDAVWALVVLAIGAPALVAVSAIGSLLLTAGETAVGLQRQAVCMVGAGLAVLALPMNAVTIALILVGADFLGLLLYARARRLWAAG